MYGALKTENPTMSSHTALVRRVRLIFNRSYTATVRHRFTRAADKASVATLCPHAACAASGLDESIEHLLLDCPLYATERAHLASRGLAPHRLSLSLRTILNPPASRGSAMLHALLVATDQYIAAIADTRQAAGLPALDDCPALDQPPPPDAHAHPRLHSHKQRRRAAASRRRAAPPALDTG